MLYYKIALICNVSMPQTKEEFRSLVDDIRIKTDALYRKNEKNYLFLSALLENSVELYGIVSDIKTLYLEKFFKTLSGLGIEIKSYRLTEITLNDITDKLSMACRRDFIEDDDEIIEAFGLEPLLRYRNFGERISNIPKSKESLIESVHDALVSESLDSELDRIYEGCKKKGVYGHPVHYIVRADKRETRNTIYQTLLSALAANGRVKSCRYAYTDLAANGNFNAKLHESLYKSSIGGAVVVRVLYGSTDDGEFSSQDTTAISSICQIAEEYRNKVLTVFCFPSAARETEESFLLKLKSMSFIELYENEIFAEQAVAYLKSLAKKRGVRSNKQLEALVCDGTGYRCEELNEVFERWYSDKLKGSIYPQYREIKTVRSAEMKKEPQGNAYKELMSLIGLGEAKRVINDALDFFKAQKIFADRGLVNETPSMHMLFTGNPGTAKTTVARLVARIMRDNGMLPNGHIYEVGRSELVGKYVGHTAPLVKNAFEKARGGVLFIDEAYSLVDDRDGLFGDEAINTIVAEMENHRKDTVVIFAGYPEKMENFLQKNPGLRSRITFHIPFEDYSADELCNISGMIADNMGLKLTDDAVTKLGGIFESARKKTDFGNGRYARNIIEKAKMTHASRLVKMDYDSISDTDIITLSADDIIPPTKPGGKYDGKIGF